MSLLDVDKDYEYDIIKQNLINVEEVNIPALQQAWYDTFAYYSMYKQDPISSHLLNLYMEDMGIPYKSKKYSNGPIYMTPYIVDRGNIRLWVGEFSRGEHITKIEDLATFAVGCLNISWTVISGFEHGLYRSSYLIDHSPPSSIYPMGNVITVESKYNFYRQQIEMIVEDIKKGTL